MPTDRVRIVPPNDPRGEIAMGIFLGVLVGAINVHATLWIIREVRLSVTWIYIVMAAMSFGPFLLAAGTIPFFSAPERLIRRFVPTFACSYVLAWQLSSSNSMGGADLLRGWGLSDLVLLLVLVIGAFVLMLLALLWRWIIRTFVVRVVEQDGEYCWRCAYRLGADSITRCPECGTPRSAQRYRYRVFYWVAGFLKRRARWLATAVVVLLVGWTGSAIWFVGWHQSRLIGMIERSQCWAHPDLKLLGEYRFSPGSVRMVFVDVRGLSWEWFVVGFVPRSDDPPIMQIRNARQSYWHRKTLEPQLPMVICDLDYAQTEAVLRGGIPKALLDEMVAAERRADPGSSMTIDPTPYFTETGATR